MKNVKRFRGESGMTQSDLAKKIKITRAGVVNLEKDECHSTSKNTTEALCQVFGVSPCKLYGIDNLRYPPESKEDLDELITILKEEYSEWV